MTDRSLIYAAAFLRALAVGLIGVLFALYLAAGGFHAGQIGILIAVGLAGSALGTFLISFWADSLGRRRMLILFTACMAAGGIGLVLSSHFLWLIGSCFLGMVNAFGRERGAIYTLEQAILPETVESSRRTHTLAWYNIGLDAGLAVGSLLGGLPFFFRKSFGLGVVPSYQWTFVLYVGCICGAFVFYSRLSPQVEIYGPTPWHKISPKTRRTITHLSLLFGLDSLAGGFLPSTLVAYWFFKRFGIGEEVLAPLFFIGHIANAASYLVAAWLSRRIGLIRTMVFTHTPANLCLIALPFAPTLSIAFLLYVVRECLVEMDLPTRQSYVMAVVAPTERTIAAGVTNLTRLGAWTIAPSIAGIAMKGMSLSFPLFFGGGLKIVYDVCLFCSFRHQRPLEEHKKEC